MPQGARASAASVGCPIPGWSWAPWQAPPAFGLGYMLWLQQHQGAWAGWGQQVGPGYPFDVTSPGAIPYCDIAMPLGEHLTIMTRDRILWGEYVDVFSLLFLELEKQDKEDLDDHLKEHIKHHNIDRTYANWYLGFLIYAGAVICHQLWWTLSLLQYLDLIYKTYIDFLRPAWIQYNEHFCMCAAMNHMLCWDQVHSLLWLQITNHT